MRSRRLIEVVVVSLVVGGVLIWQPWQRPITCIPLSLLRLEYERQLDGFQRQWKRSGDQTGSGLHGMEESEKAYVERLKKFAREALPGHKELLDPLDRINAHVSPRNLRLPDIVPRKIYTCNKTIERDTGLFSRWSRTHPDWAIEVFDDAAIERYVRKTIYKTPFYEAFQRLPDGIYKSDIMRYLLLLLDGGLYVDSDTWPRAHATIWGHHPITGLQGSLDAIATLIHAAHDKVPLHLAAFGNNLHPIEDPTISVIVAGELSVTDAELVKAGEPAQRNVKSFARHSQICNWTMMSKKHHPIFLDILQTIYSLLVKLPVEPATGKIDKKNIPNALDFTGPGPFSDAVYRYLLRLGYNPSDSPVDVASDRIGDVILLPERATASTEQSDIPITPNTFHGHHEVSGHGFEGRWRPSADPYFLDTERDKGLR